MLREGHGCAVSVICRSRARRVCCSERTPVPFDVRLVSGECAHLPPPLSTEPPRRVRQPAPSSNGTTIPWSRQRPVSWMPEARRHWSSVRIVPGVDVGKPFPPPPGRSWSGGSTADRSRRSLASGRRFGCLATFALVAPLSDLAGEVTGRMVEALVAGADPDGGAACLIVGRGLALVHERGDVPRRGSEGRRTDSRRPRLPAQRRAGW